MSHRQNRLLTIGLLAGMVFLSSIFSLQGTLLSSTIDTFSLSDSSQGLPSAAAAAGGVIALLSSLAVCSRVPKLTLLKLSVILCIFALALLKLSPTFTAFVFLWGITGIGLGYLDALLSACMADIYQGAMARKMMCYLHLTYGLTSMIAPIIYTCLLSHFAMEHRSWSSTYWCVAAFGLGLFIYLTLVSRNTAQAPQSALQAEQKLPLAQWRRQIKGGLLPGLALAMFFHGIFLNGISTWINRYVGVTLQGQLGDMALSFLFLGVMLSRLVIPQTKITSEGYLCTAGWIAFAVLAAALPFKSPWAMCIASCVSGLLFGAMIPCILTVACEKFPSNTMFITTVMMLALYLGQVMGSPMIGALERVFNLHIGIGACAGFIALASLCCLLVPGIRSKIRQGP